MLLDPSPPALPSFTATIQSSYNATGHNCDAEYCDKPGKGTEFFERYEHVRVATLKLYFDVKQKRARLDTLKYGKVESSIIATGADNNHLHATRIINVNGKLCSVYSRTVSTSFPDTAASLAWYGFAEVPGYDSWTALPPWPFTPVDLDTYDGTDSGVATWESEDNIGNFGASVATISVVANGTALGTPTYTEVDNSLYSPSGTGSSGNVVATATFSETKVGSPPATVFAVPAAC